MPPNVGTRSVTAAALSADVKSLIAAQESLEVDPIKGTFERVIAVLVLVKVRGFLLFQSLRSLSAIPSG